MILNELNLHFMQIKVDGTQNIFTSGPSVIVPVTPNEYYFGWTASTGAIYSVRTLKGWFANITERT